MKVIALTLCFAAMAAAQLEMDLHLKCTHDEIGIRWPSYYSNSEYFICYREHGRQVKEQCPPGEIFTFVLQICTSPSRFIPPPPMEVLPTGSSLGIQPIPESPKPLFPRPIHPIDLHPAVPPVLVDQPHLPPVIIDDLPLNHPPVIVDNELPAAPEEEISGPPNKPPSPPSLPGKPEGPSKDPSPPLPPTPAPTPPVVPVAQPGKKPAGKKPPVAPNASKKQPPAPPKAGKKQPPKPAGKKTPPAPPKKA